MPWAASYERDLLKYFMGLGTVSPPSTFYLALSSATANPASTWTELTQSNYSRQPITWTYGGDFFATNSAQIDFVNLGGGNIVGQGIWTTSGVGTGTLVFWSDLVNVITTVAGDTVSYKPGYLKVNF